MYESTMQQICMDDNEYIYTYRYADADRDRGIERKRELIGENRFACGVEGRAGGRAIGAINPMSAADEAAPPPPSLLSSERPRFYLPWSSSPTKKKRK